MNLFQKVHDRLTGVIGRDCNGKPIRKGDTVMVINDGTVKPECVGIIAVVLGSLPEMEGYPGLPVLFLDDVSRVTARSTRRLDEPKDQEADWQTVADSIGWTPRHVDQPREVPV